MAELRIEKTKVRGSTWVERAGRVGFAVKGVTYMLLAFIALRAALGNGNAQNTRGAMREIEGPTLGDIALLLIAIGLGAYALWKLYFALANPEHHKLLKRMGAVFVGLFNGGLAVEAARLALFRPAAGGGGNHAAHWSSLILAQPLGTLALALVGAAIAIYGIGRIVKAIKARLDEQLRLRELAPGPRKLVVSASRIGIAARGVVFILVGVFLMRAAARANPAEAKDFGYSLRELQEQPFGPWLLALVALGLFLYGVYGIVRARYRRFQA